MFASTPSGAPAWRHHVQDQEEDLVRELMQANDVDAVLARMEGDHFRHLSPIMRKLGSYDASAMPPPQSATPASTTPRTHATPPPPPPPPGSSAPRGYTGGGHDWSPTAASPGTRQYLPALSSAASTSMHTRLDDTGVMGQASPTARPPPPPPPPPFQQHGPASSSGYGDVARDPLAAYRRPPQTRATAAAAQPDARNADTRYQGTMDSWLRQEPDVTAEPPNRRQRVNPFAHHATPGVHVDAAMDVSAGGSLLPPPTPGSPWSPSAGRYHGGTSVPTGHGASMRDATTAAEAPGRQQPRVTTRVTSTSPPRARSAAGDLGELENASQSRIARQLQLLRNYRELAELCSSTSDPSADLFRALPSEELARMQAEQLQALAQRERSPITVNNNYYFEPHSSSTGERRGSSGRGGGVEGTVRSAGPRSRVGSGDSPGSGAHGRLSPGPAAGPGNSRSISEVLTADSHAHGGGSASQRASRPPPLLPSPRAVPLQSPQPSSGPDSPVATPPLALRVGPLAPPSPSRSQRGRSHRSRQQQQQLLQQQDAHYTPTATTEEAGSSYEEDEDEAAVGAGGGGDGGGAGDDEEDYAGDFIDNGDEDGFGYGDDDGAPFRRPPPRIIEREQHRRFPNASAGGDDGFASSLAALSQPPLAPSTLQQHQLQQQAAASPMTHQHQRSYSGDYVNSQSLTTIHDGNRDGGSYSAAPPAGRSGSALYIPGASRNSIAGGAAGGSDGGGRRSVSSAINVLSGEQELRANAQLSAARAGRDDRRPSQSQLHHERRMSNALSGSAAGANPSRANSPHHPQQQQQRRRSMSAGSAPPPARGGGALTDPGGSPDYLPLHDQRRSSLEHGGSRQGSPTAASRRAAAGAGGRRVSATPTPEKRPGASSGTSGATAPGTQRDRRRPGRGDGGESDGTPPSRRRQSNAERGHGGGVDSGRGSESDGDDDDPRHRLRHRLGSGSYGSEGDTPGNPQLQTHNPYSSAQHKRRSLRTGSGGRSAGRRGRDRDGGDDDDSVHTPRDRVRAGRKRAAVKTDIRQSRSGLSGSRGARYGGRAATAAAHRGDSDEADVRSAASFSYSYTTSSDISDYVPGSYYSPIKSLRQGGRGGAGAGRGGAAARPAVGRPGGGPGGVGGRGRGAPGAVGVGPGGTSPGPRLLGGAGTSPQRLAQMRQQQQQQSPGRVSGYGGAAAGAAAPAVAPVAAARMVRLPDGRVVPVTSPAAQQYQQALMRLSAASRLPLGHPMLAAVMRQQYQQQQQQQMPRLGGVANAAPYPTASAMPSPPRQDARVASPSAVGHRPEAGQAAGGAAHVQPGLLYGSLLPKARPKTALVVETDGQGRSRSVDPHGDATHAALLDRGSVYQVQSARTSGIRHSRMVSGNDEDKDEDGDGPVAVFPIASGPINGSTSGGVQPLAWRSGGADCVVGRSGHVPAAPRAKLSSHYRTASAPATPQHQQRQQQPQRSPQSQRPPLVMDPYAAAPHLGSASAGAASATQPPPPPAAPSLAPAQLFKPLNPAERNRRDSAYSLHSSPAHASAALTPAQMYDGALQSRRASTAVTVTVGGSGGALGGSRLATAQQRYNPTQESLDAAAGYGRRPSAQPQQQQQQVPYSASTQSTTAARSANAQRFGISALPG